MIQNNLDPEVAENPKELVVYGGIGRAARNWECFDAIVAALRELDDDESLLIQSGKPVGVFKTHPDAPRVLIANSNLVPKWATWEHFNELDRKGLMMFGQMTAGSWIYIGSQGIVQGTYETFAEAGRQHCGGELADKWILTAGLGGMGGAQPLAATMAGASMLAIECQQSRIEMRLATRYLDRQAKDLDDALAILRDACAQEGARVGRSPRQCRRDPARARSPWRATRHGHRPDVRARSRLRLLARRLDGRALEGRAGRSGAASRSSCAAAKQSIVAHVDAMLAFHRQGIPTFDYGNNIRQVAFDEGRGRRVRVPGFRAGVHPAAVLRGQGPVPLGRAVRRSRGHLQDGPQGAVALSGQCASPALARHGARADRVPGAAGAHLLAGPGRAAPRRPRIQRDGEDRRTQGADRHRPRPSRHRQRRYRQIARPRRWRTAPTRCPTGRC